MKIQRIKLVYILLAVLLIVMMILNMVVGSSSMTAGDAVRILLSHDTTSKFGKIMWDIRMPRILAALFLGGALSVSGFLLQTFFANPIAGPYILGISSGAKLTVACAMIFTMTQGVMMNSFMMIVTAFVGALLVTAAILLISGKVRSMAILIVCGVMVGYICSAITEFLVTFADDSNIVNLHNWSRGSFSGQTWENVRIMAIVVFIAFVLIFLMAKPLYAYSLGESYAMNLGVNIKVLRVLIVLLSGLLSACIVAFAGPISFVGIAAPHLVRKIFNTDKPIIMIPACFMGGSVFCLFCDLLARNLLSPTELNISTVTAVFGAPIVIIILLNKKGRAEQ
jgi:iron complex transport system permease protein